MSEPIEIKTLLMELEAEAHLMAARISLLLAMYKSGYRHVHEDDTPYTPDNVIDISRALK